jgi:hypothetical protein
LPDKIKTKLIELETRIFNKRFTKIKYEASGLAINVLIAMGDELYPISIESFVVLFVSKNKK